MGRAIRELATTRRLSTADQLKSRHGNKTRNMYIKTETAVATQDDINKPLEGSIGSAVLNTF